MWFRLGPVLAGDIRHHELVGFGTPDRARKQAEMLVEQAIEHLSSHGSEADLLRAIAAFVTERDR